MSHKISKITSQELRHESIITFLVNIMPSMKSDDWYALHEANRALNWELWHGPLPANYWTEVEPLDHYDWRGWRQACEDLKNMLDELPSVVYYDHDTGWVGRESPDNDGDNWIECDRDGAYYIGPESWEKVNVAKFLLHDEVWKQIY